MTKILPTVGRVVWFTPSRLTGDGRFAHIDGRRPARRDRRSRFQRRVGELGRFR